MGVVETINKLISIGKDAADNTAKSFSGLTGENADIHFTGLRFVPVEFIPEQFTDETCKVVRINFDGILSGTSVLMINEEDSVKLEKLLLLDMIWDGLINRTELPEYSEIEESVINEVANVVLASFLNVFANALKDEINITTPEFTKNTGFNIVESLVLEMADKGINNALVFDNTIDIVGRFPVRSNIFILIDPEKLENLERL
ncbi:CheC, inhibitor of MCP methylation [Methanococcus vannielii SB]|uniref:CheC, inhibitor of MCP methylation n=1 Tax=Methanococcus vannielii (strain ATCC 35089 / DSM 1224 / JCM 13029 / OCM 148 / SB) TaxID=406327 RepID=A6UNU5_METVS|nr:chemotaxis protein CheC [Methanococcus vannielii]ABR54167.1 CheC, inhibitor of MCP methylation [Methanococcus vannielii SB]